jgi:tRNA pseudouridine13 synthase
MPESSPLPDWTHVEKPVARGLIKTTPQDFLVEEVLGFELTGRGEHLYLLVEKCGMNTLDMVKILARTLKLNENQISYAGLKDKQAITRQWLSLYTPGDIDTARLESGELEFPGFRVLASQRHASKLKRGAHQANRFEVVIRGLSNIRDFDAALSRVQKQGVPNYFGEQRFGRGGRNIDKARALFASELKVQRQLRGMYLSAARSFLFNQVLSERVQQQSWGSGMPGEVFILDGSNSFFKTDSLDETLRERLGAFDIHPSAPMWGKGALSSSGEVFKLETEVVARHPDLSEGLEAFGLRQQRRATRLVPKDVSVTRIDDTSLKLSFQLSKGNFATTVLRELITIDA